MATTPFVSMNSLGGTPPPRIGSRARWAAIGLLLALLALAVVACGTARAADPTAGPPVTAAASAPAGAAASPTPSALPSPTAPPQPLRPAQAGADPLSLMAFAFTPIFQALFILLAELYALTGNIVIAIVLMTLLI